jgi:hypothetical protein
MRFPNLLLVAAGALAILAGPAVAGSFDLAVSPAEVGPGDSITLDISNAPANSRVLIFSSVDPTPFTIGPVETRCGTIEINLDLTPRGGGAIRAAIVAVTDMDGNATVTVDVPPSLSSRFDGLEILFQGVAATFTVDPPGCSFEICTSTVGSTTIVVP